MYSAGKRAKAKTSLTFIALGALLVIIGASLSAIGVVSTIYWCNDGYTDTYYFTGAYVCGVPGMVLGIMYFCYYAKASKCSENVDIYLDIKRGLLRLENHIARFTLFVFALGLYSIPMSIAGIIKHSDNSSRGSIHLIFSICIMLVCLFLYVAGGLSCLKLTSQGMRVKILKSSEVEIRYRHNTGGSDSNDTVFTVADCNLSQVSVPSDSVNKEKSTHL